MKAEYIIKDCREGMEELNKLHLQWLASDGLQGCQCLNYEEFKLKLNRSDEEILNDAESKGLYIVDKEEYLNKIKKESE